MSKQIYIGKPGDESVFIYIPNILKNIDILELELWLKSLKYIGGTAKNGAYVKRKQIWYQEEEKYFCEKWLFRYPRWEGNLYTQILKKIQLKMRLIICDINISKELPIILNEKLNSCLVNLYENGNDKISPHKDSSDSFGFIPTIINLSIGQTRILRLTNNDEIIDFPLEHNSLFIMAGSSQKNYRHEIIEEKKIKKKRYSLTFRELL